MFNYSAFRNFARSSHFPVEDSNDSFRLNSTSILQLRSTSYFDQWRLIYENKWFNLKMRDNSFFIFSIGDTKASFSYFPCPLNVLSIDDYLVSEGLEVTSRTIREYRDIYEEILFTAELKEAFTPIRYDYDPRCYRKGVHPAAHMHIGTHNSIRLAVSCKLSPIGFLLFVMRQEYPECWSRLIGSNNAPCLLRSSVRIPDDPLAHEVWSEIDMLELHLN